VLSSRNRNHRSLLKFRLLVSVYCPRNFDGVLTPRPTSLPFIQDSKSLRILSGSRSATRYVRRLSPDYLAHQKKRFWSLERSDYSLKQLFSSLICRVGRRVAAMPC